MNTDHQFQVINPDNHPSKHGCEIDIQFSDRNFLSRFQLGYSYPEQNTKGSYWAISSPVVISDSPTNLESVDIYEIGDTITLEGQEFEIVEMNYHNIAFSAL